MLSSLLLLLLLLPAAAQPVISRVSSGSAAAPNDTVVLAGVGLDSAAAVLCPLSAPFTPCLTLPAQPSSWDGGLKFTLPPAPSSIGAFSIAACINQQCSNASQAQRYTLNAPRVAWTLGQGDSAGVEAGGVLRVLGAALALNPATGVCAPLLAATTDYAPGALDPALFPPGAAAALAAAPPLTATTAILCSAASGACGAALPLLLASCHRLDLAIPAAQAPGAYTLRIHNGLASTAQGLGVLDSEATVAVLPPRALPSSPALTVGKDCDIVQCLARVQASGGGAITLPPGATDVPANVALVIPPGTTLRGAGMGQSTLRWLSNTQAGAPTSALTCTGPALLTGFSLQLLSPAVNALVFGGGSAGCRGDALSIIVDTLANFPGWGIGPAFSTGVGAGFWSLTNSALSHRGNCSAQQSWPHNTAYTVWGAHDGLFANNSVLCFCQGHSTDSSQRILFDGNAVFSLGADSQGSGFSTFEDAQVLEHIYIGRSLDVGNPSAAKRWESMTLDGPGGAIFDTFAALSSSGSRGEAQTLTLRQPARAGPYGSRNISTQFMGASVSVLYGPGLGGTARVRSFTPTNASWSAALEVELHPPLLTRPVPGASYLAINPFRGSLVWEGNTMVNDTTWQLWAQATDVTLAGSYFSAFHGGSVLNWGLFYQCPWGNGGAGFSCAWQPNIGTDFLGNTLRCLGSMGVITSDYAGVSPVNLTLALGLTRRRNTLLGGTKMSGSGRTDDVTVEHTVFGDAVCQGASVPAGGMDIGSGVEHVLVR